jgi:fermentation-respiration switch protein FrsA (DUF1100 family)
VEDINDSVEGQLLSAERLVPQTRSLGPADLGLELEVPVFIIQGADDFTTPTELAHSYFDAIAAPIKAFVPIDGAGHFAVFMRSDRFLEELVRRVRPLAVEQDELGNTPSTSRSTDSGAEQTELAISTDRSHFSAL